MTGPMEPFLLLLPVALPIAFWAAYHMHVDRCLPEPMGHLALAFAMGVGSYFLGMAFYRLLGLFGLRFDAFALAESSPLGLLAYAILAIGVLEETAKFLPFLLVVLRFREFDEPIDGIIYASFIALGFSAVENLNYRQFLDTREAFAWGFAGPVVHMVFASIWGYYAGRAWLRRRRLLPVMLGSLGVAALVHGLYDFIVIGTSTRGLPFSAALIVGLWIWRLRLIRDLHWAAASESRAEEPERPTNRKR